MDARLGQVQRSSSLCDRHDLMLRHEHSMLVTKARVSAPAESVGPCLHTEFMTRELMRTVLDAQHVNATLSGHALRAAADNLTQLNLGRRVVLKAFDAAGERIIGAALTLRDDLEAYDYTRPFPERTTCLLVGGVIAGPVAAAAAAEAAVAGGATRVVVAILGGWNEPIPGVDRVREIGAASAQVA